MQPGWWDVTDCFREKDLKDGTTELKVPAVVKPQTEMTAARLSPTTFGELMQALNIIPGQPPMPPVISRQGSHQMRLGLEKPQADDHIVSLMPKAVPDLSQMEIGKPVQPVSIYPCL